MRTIDADALKKTIDKELEKADLSEYEACVCVSDIYDKCIDNAPTIPQPDFKEGYKQAILDGKTNFSRPQGEWIAHEDGYNVCPYCKNRTAFSYPFCPYCGADMRKGGAE